LAVAAARKAFNTTWKATTPADRGRMLLKLADLIERDAELLIAVESLNNGKPTSLSKGDVDLVIGCIRYYGGWADKIEGKTIDIGPGMFVYTKNEPVSKRIAAILRTSQLTAIIAWCLRPDHSLELPPTYACMEDWTCSIHRQHCRHEDR
jgi:hypothetical protein